MPFGCRYRSKVSRLAAARLVASKVQVIAAQKALAYSDICEHFEQRITQQFASCVELIRGFITPFNQKPYTTSLTQLYLQYLVKHDFTSGAHFGGFADFFAYQLTRQGSVEGDFVELGVGLVLADYLHF